MLIKDIFLKKCQLVNNLIRVKFEEQQETNAILIYSTGAKRRKQQIRLHGKKTKQSEFICLAGCWQYPGREKD